MLVIVATDLNIDLMQSLDSKSRVQTTTFSYLLVIYAVCSVCMLEIVHAFVCACVKCMS